MIVELEIDIDHSKEFQCENKEEYYNKFHKKDGILYDKEAQAIYYEVEFPFMPMNGQNVSTRFGRCNVIHSMLQLENTSEYFFDRSRILVKQDDLDY